MSGRFDQRIFDQLLGISARRVEVARERLRMMLYADGPDSQPPGFDNLDSPDKVATFSRFISRQATREQHKTVPGDLNQTIAAHPAVQGMVTDAGAEMLDSQPPPDEGV